MAPLRERPFCFSHDPERADEAAEARRLGGLRRRREGTIAVAYDLPGLDSVAGIRRLLDIVVTDGVGLENGIARLRVLISTAAAATSHPKVGEFQERLDALERAHRTEGDEVATRGLGGGLLDGPADAWPLVRIGAQVEAAVRGALPGKPKAVVWQAVHRSVGDAYFLVELIIGVNLAAEELCRFEGTRWALLTQWMRALTLEAELAGRRRVGGPDAGEGPTVREVDTWRAGLAVSVATVYAEEAARSRLEERYLRGCPVLFPALVDEWDALRGRLEGLGVVSDHVAILRGSGSTPLALAGLHETVVDLTSTRIAELTEMARVGALEMLGENEQAGTIVEQRLRPLVGAT